jgi:hypothetical protein
MPVGDWVEALYGMKNKLRPCLHSYCNDVMAYIPSLRVLKEGGYEGATSMIAYGQPTAWGDRIEEDIIASVRELVSETRRP